jgi:hypothetical protein
MSRQTFACGCVLESDDLGIDLLPCSKHIQEYIETYELDASKKKSVAQALLIHIKVSWGPQQAV